MSTRPDRHKLLQRLLPLILLLSVGLLLALSLILAGMANGASLPRLGFLMLACLGAGMILLTLTALSGKTLRLTPARLRWGLIAGAFFALPNALAFSAIPRVGAGIVSMSFAFPLLLTWLIALAAGMEPWQRLRFIGVMLGVAGGVILAQGKAMTLGQSAWWLAPVALIPLLVAGGNIYRSRWWPEGATPLSLAGLMLLGASLTLLPLVIALEPDMPASLLGSATGRQLLMAEVAIFTLLYALYCLLQQLAGAVYMSQIGIVAAPFGILLAVSWLNEPVPANLVIAAPLVLLGTLVFQYTQHRTRAGVAIHPHSRDS